MHPLNPLRTRRARFERITEILSLADHLPVPELHDAHRVRRLPVVGEDEFSDPEVGSADDPPHREALLVRLGETGCLNVVPATDALPRLRIFEHCMLLVNPMLRLEVVRVGGGPVTIQSCPNLPVFHLDRPPECGVPCGGISRRVGKIASLCVTGGHGACAILPTRMAGAMRLCPPYDRRLEKPRRPHQRPPHVR